MLCYCHSLIQSKASPGTKINQAQRPCPLTCGFGQVWGRMGKYGWGGWATLRCRQPCTRYMSTFMKDRIRTPPCRLAMWTTCTDAHRKPAKGQPSNVLVTRKGSMCAHRRSGANRWSLCLSAVILFALPRQSITTATTRVNTRQLPLFPRVL